jgi:hypothetical protein
VTGLVNALKAPAMKQLRRNAAAISLSLNVQGIGICPGQVSCDR